MLVIEHNLDVIKTADWVIDMGPEGGNRGGTVVAEGTPEDGRRHPESFTGEFLAPLLDGREAKQPTRRLSADTAPTGRPAAKKAPAKKATAKKAATRKTTAKKTTARKGTRG